MPHIESVGRYELLFELAKGGMAELFLGRLHGVGGFAKLVAIKRILPHLAQDKLFVEMFLNEGRIAAHLSHPNVCQVHELGEANGTLFLAMEYLDGASWDALIRDQPRTPPDNARTLRLVAGVIAQACEGLHYAHELRDLDGTPTPVIHRDVSPQNLFITVDGACKVLDFGVSKMIKDGPRTRTGVLKGKLPYMSPEQIQGETVDSRSDVFALGAVVWEALAGVSLFDRDTDFLIWKAITEAPIPLLAPHGYPPEIDAVLARALARDRNERFPTARALGEALREAAARVGGSYADGEIATALEAACGDRIAERGREVASVVTQRRTKATVEPTAGDTIEDDAATSSADSTISLRSEPVRITREREPEDEALDRPARRSPWPLLAGGLALIAGVVTVLAVNRGADTAKPTPAPVAEPPIVQPTAPAISEPSPAAVVVPPAETATVVDAPRPAKPGKPKPAKPKPAKPTPAVPVPRDPGTYSIDSTEFAKIYIDGSYVDDTPLFRKQLAAGKHTVRAVHGATGREKTFTIQIEAGKPLSSGRLTW